MGCIGVHFWGFGNGMDGVTFCVYGMGEIFRMDLKRSGGSSVMVNESLISIMRIEGSKLAVWGFVWEGDCGQHLER